MLLQLVFDLLLGVVTVFLNLLPTFDLSVDFVDGLNSLSEFSSTFAYFLPIKTIISCLSVVFLLDNIRFLILIFNFIIRKLPTIN